MNVPELLERLRREGARLRAVGDRLKVVAPQGAVTPEIRDALGRHKAELLARLADSGDTEIARSWQGGETALSFMQERMWYFSRMGNGAVFNVAAAYWLKGELDRGALGRALNDLVARQAALRSYIVEHDGEPRQRYARSLDVPLPLEDYSYVGKDYRQIFLDDLFEHHCRHDFDVSEPPLFYFRLFRFEKDLHVLFCNIHHGLTDAWSFNVILRELCEGYAAHSRGDEPQLPPLEIEFPDWIQWQREEQLPARMEEELEYWEETLEGPLPTFDLPTDHPRPPMFSMEGNDFPFELDAELVRRFSETGRAEGATAYMVLVAALQLAIHVFSKADDIIVATPVAGRSHEEIRKLVGAFLNTVAIRSRVDETATLAEFLGEVRQGVLGALAHQVVPFDIVVRNLDLPRDPTRPPVYQVTLNLWDITDRPWQWGELEVEPLRVSTPWTHSEYTMWLKTLPDGRMKGWCTYATKLFRKETALRLARGVRQVLEAYADDPSLRVSELDLATGREQTPLQGHRAGRSGPGPSLADVVLHRVADHPDRMAVVDDERELTYAEVAAEASSITSGLVEAGVEPGDRVAVLVDREARVVPLFLGILRAGAAFVPIDPEYPAERIAYILEDSGVRLAVTSGSTGPPAVEGVRLLPVEVLVDSDHPDRSEATAIDRAHPEDLAYVIYTSGSTGRPKGVAVRRDSVLNLMESFAREPGVAPDDVWLAVTTLSFDISILELLLPVYAGAKVVIAPTRVIEDPFELLERWEEWSPSVLQATPSFWQMLFDVGWEGASGLRVFCGGEALPVSLARRLLPGVKELWNLYGPTETTVWSLLHRVTDEDLELPSIPIGRPIPETSLLVVDEELRPVPHGVIGELVIGGRGVARGYWERPGLSEEQFVELPRIGRAYRTGDLVRIRPGEIVEFRGRVDHQIKVRGHRIEPGEIETALMAHPAIREAVVDARTLGPGDNRLIAWIDRSREDRRTVTEIRQELRSFLPEAMIPGLIVDVDAIPRTLNGKVDRAALSAPTVHPGSRGEHRLPETPNEKLVASSWRRLLQVDEVGKDDNFFELGGHSLLSIRAAAEIERETGSRFDPRLLFFYTLEQVAASLDGY